MSQQDMVTGSAGLGPAGSVNCTSKLQIRSRQGGRPTTRRLQLSDSNKKSGHGPQIGARHQDGLAD
jgi:hypothetical protein